MPSDEDPGSPPPPVIDYSRVIAYAIVDSEVEWTGRQRLFVGGELLGCVPRLAICQNVSGPLTDILLLHCDESWASLGCSGGPTVDDVKAIAERAYRGITAKWVETGVTAEQAESWIRENHADDICSFCGSLPTAYENAFYGNRAAICFGCVRKLHEAMQNSEGHE
jgi:hypothetical protein